MERQERIEALERLVKLLDHEQIAIERLDVDGALAAAGAIDTLWGPLQQCLAAPLQPREQALLSTVRRLTGSTRRALARCCQPLLELAALAAEHQVAAVLDSRV